MNFTHEPRAPYIPSGDETQRHFGRDNCDRIAQSVRVFRFAGHQTASLDVCTPFSADTSAELSVRLKPAELRELAQRLLDAAHDIEAESVAARAA